MALGPRIFDRVKETTTTTGTGTVTLGGAVAGYQSFAVVGDGNKCYYCIAAGAEWEVGVGTYTLSGTTLSRTTILASSNSGSAVSFSAGSKSVFVDFPAALAAAVSNRNFILNPGPDIWQAGTSFTPVAGTRTRTADGWFALRSTNANYTVQRSAAETSGAKYQIVVKRTAATSDTNVIQLGLTLDPVDIAWITSIATPPTFCFSFYAEKGANYSAASSNLVVTAIEGSGSNTNVLAGFSGATTKATFTQALTTTLTRYSFAFTLDTASTELGIIFSFTPVGTAGANDTFIIEGAKLELGGFPTPWVPLSRQDELKRCQKYYYHTFNQGTVPGNSAEGGLARIFASSVSGPATSTFPTATMPMRRDTTHTTITLYDPASGADPTYSIDRQSLDSFAGTFDVAGGSPGDAIPFHFTASDTVY